MDKVLISLQKYISSSHQLDRAHLSTFVSILHSAKSAQMSTIASIERANVFAYLSSSNYPQIVFVIVLGDFCQRIECLFAIHHLFS